VLPPQIPLESVDVGSYDLMNVRRALAEKSNGKPPTPAQVHAFTVNLTELSCMQSTLSCIACCIESVCLF
jgi:hypothetical protein